MTLLAQIQNTTPPPSLSGFLESAFYIIGLITAAVVLYRQFFPAKLNPQPLEVRENHATASRKEIDELHGRIKRERIEIDAALKELKEADLRVAQRIDTEMKDINDRIDALPERIIKLLRETKGLL
jgi:polyhydroxyalkanoate synthesis regulator phasin